MKNYLFSLATDKNKNVIAGVLKFLLFLLSVAYGGIVRILIYVNQKRAVTLNCKVISVGNITLGGTGKTSLVEFIARFLKQKGKKIAVLSRGYKRVMMSQDGDCRQMGDEPYMLQRNLKDVPVIVDADRVRGAAKAIKDFGADTVILDDGFQQWKIRKDLEIVSIDATCPFGNRNMLPRGILREPLSSLRRADIFVLTKSNLKRDVGGIKSVLNKLNPKALIFESVHEPVGFYEANDLGKGLALDSFRGKRVILFSGIGDPDSFENLVRSLEIKVVSHFRFGDHHYYSQEDLNNITKAAQENGAEAVITTEKDAVRLGAGKSQVLVFKIEVKIKDEERFFNRLLKLYSV
ncbi:MAG: tetraacyldisaccharide 4'-kinase [Candidatus Omnitrophica bacterium]|nr:tetraacyldisaccharide 4'-kinase [Candidatus Omnitrophota bacterium]MBU1869983.1 tetraacyldisaccharide 4'-kinase [Candidatus Omnitrophota bacterium]